MQQSLVQHHHDGDITSQVDRNDIFGFWIYIMSDCILFSVLFATYIVLRQNIYGGPSIKDITDIPSVFTETMALLFSSFTYGLAILSSYQKKRNAVIFWLLVTVLLGFVFVHSELSEFIHLFIQGHTWQTSAALSAFFTLVGTHGLHVSIGLLWMIILLFQLFKYNINTVMSKRLVYLGLFWSFLDIVWIFVFTIVYLMGSM